MCVRVTVHLWVLTSCDTAAVPPSVCVCVILRLPVTAGSTVTITEDDRERERDAKTRMQMRARGDAARSPDPDLPLPGTPLRLLHQSIGRMKTGSCHAFRKGRGRELACISAYALVCAYWGNAPGENVTDIMQAFEGPYPHGDYLRQICFLVLDSIW